MVSKFSSSSCSRIGNLRILSRMFLWEGLQNFWKVFSGSRHPYVHELLTRVPPQLFGVETQEKPGRSNIILCMEGGRGERNVLETEFLSSSQSGNPERDFLKLHCIS